MPPLSEDQYTELNLAILGYLKSQKCPLPLIEDLCSHFNLSSSVIEPDPILEQKWTALIRLQKRILALESQLKTTNEINNQLSGQLKNGGHASLPHPSSSSSSSSSSSLANWIPKSPPHSTLIGHRAKVNCVSLHPKWSMAASGSDDGSIKVWDTESSELEKTVYGHTRPVLDVDFASVSGLLVSCSADLSVRIWDPSKSFANTLTLLGHDHTVSSVKVTFDPNTEKEFVLSASRDKTIRVWDLETGFVLKVLRGHTDWVRTIDVTKYAKGETQYVVSAGSDRTVRLTNIFGPETTNLVFQGHKHVIECVSIAPEATRKFIQKHFNVGEDEILFVSAGRDCKIFVWGSKTPEPLFELSGHDNWVRGVYFHPNGRFLFSVSDDKTLRIWDLVSKKQVKCIDAHEHFVTCISGIKSMLITGSVDETVRVWK